MKVAFASDVLEEESCWRSLDRIVDFFLSDQHIWNIDDFDLIVSSNWMRSDIHGRAGKTNQSAIDKIYTDSIYPKIHQLAHSIGLTVTLDPKAETDLPPLEAIKCLASPAYVLVENAESDGAFLEAMIHAFRRRTLLDAHTDGRWVIEHMGGVGEAKKRVAQLRERTTGPNRIFVIVDSDRLYPGHVTRGETWITKTCDELGVRFHILNKRKIENYLTEVCLQSSGKTRRFRAFLFLNQDQRDFFEMKGGFKTHNNAMIIPKEQAQLYEKVSSHVLRNLQGGFGDEAWRLFKTARHMIRSEDILRICGNQSGEIPALLDSIEILL